MSILSCQSVLVLPTLENYLPALVDRLESFHTKGLPEGQDLVFTFSFGRAIVRPSPERFVMRAEAADAERLRRIKEILTVAVQLYARADKPDITWTGDLAGDTTLSNFRLMHAAHAQQITPHMRRVRLVGADLKRFGEFGGLHIRMFFPTVSVPEPVWPIAGANGLPFWPDEARKPPARVYTIRQLDAEAGTMDVDFVVHGPGSGEDAPDQCIGSNWALSAQQGDAVGILGPLGRPIADAKTYIMGCDETGLPALSRILERLPTDAVGTATIEVAERSDEQVLVAPKGIAVNWIHRNGVAAGDHAALAETLCATPWPSGGECYGWFAAEAEAAKRVRDHWRGTLQLGRDETLAAGYWKRGSAATMAA